MKRIGIRTTTDFLEVYQDDRARRQLADATKGSKDLHVDVLYVVLKQDEWVDYLCNWRKRGGTKRPMTLTYDAARLSLNGAGPTDMWHGASRVNADGTGHPRAHYPLGVHIPLFRH